MGETANWRTATVAVAALLLSHVGPPPVISTADLLPTLRISAYQKQACCMPEDRVPIMGANEAMKHGKYA